MAANERQTSLEESLLSLGEFEEAYDELWVWLSDTLKQLEEAEPITGDPDAVSGQLSRHKVGPIYRALQFFLCFIYFVLKSLKARVYAFC